jgi:hypothetical protein
MSVAPRVVVLFDEEQRRREQEAAANAELEEDEDEEEDDDEEEEEEKMRAGTQGRRQGAAAGAGAGIGRPPSLEKRARRRHRTAMEMVPFHQRQVGRSQWAQQQRELARRQQIAADDKAAEADRVALRRRGLSLWARLKV